MMGMLHRVGDLAGAEDKLVGHLAEVHSGGLPIAVVVQRRLPKLQPLRIVRQAQVEAQEAGVAPQAGRMPGRLAGQEERPRRAGQGTRHGGELLPSGWLIAQQRLEVGQVEAGALQRRLAAEQRHDRGQRRTPCQRRLHVDHQQG